MLGLLNAIQNIGVFLPPFDVHNVDRLGLGSLAAYPFAPYSSDGLGRRRTVFLGAVIMVSYKHRHMSSSDSLFQIIGTAVQSASNSVNMFIGARFCIGFGLTFAANSAPMLVTEISYPVYRAPLTSLYNSLWYLGSIV